MRDEFKASTRRILAARTGHLCSNPGCRRSTIGPGAEAKTTINIGVAAHITAASPGPLGKPAPRHDKNLTKEQRSDISNGVWLCQVCAKLIDSDEARFPAELLKNWRKAAEGRAFLSLGAPGAAANQIATAFGELDADDACFLESLSLPKNDTIEDVTVRMRNAANTDIVAFRETRTWPQNAIELNFAFNAKGEKKSVSLAGIANTIGTFSTLSLVSPPGTGKSTTLVQLAGQVVDIGLAIPILIPLGEWSGSGEDFFVFLTARRNSFRLFRQQHFQQVAFYGRLVLLIDGWNEVDAATRIQATRQLDALRRDFPLLSVIIGTRRQAVVLPGEIVEIELLNESQQLAIAQKFPGGSKEPILDQARRTSGIRELISIPLYLNALLESTRDGSYPQTKEEVLSAFVAQHEAAPDRVEILRNELFGCHNDILIGLAVEANKIDSVTISDVQARLAINKIGNRLVADGQLAVPLQPSFVLDVLVNTHAIVRSTSEKGSYSFQHQQFQEWYASIEVERLLFKAAQNDADANKILRVDVLNLPAWEESILFACERLSRLNSTGAEAVGKAIVVTLGIDAMLAAEMIYRSNDAVWIKIKNEIVAFASRWQKAGQADRSIRFMITTGRPEFAFRIWPLVASPDSQIHLRVLRIARRFRPSVLGLDVAKRLSELPDTIRGDVVAAVVHESGFDGLELGAQIAKSDSNAGVVAKIILALGFRRANRLVCEILPNTSESVLRNLADAGFPFQPMDPLLEKYFSSMRKVQNPNDTDPVRRVIQLAHHESHAGDVGGQISKIIESEHFLAKNEFAAYAIEKALEGYPDHTRSALTYRIQSGLPMPHGTDELLKDIPAIDTGPFATAVLNNAIPSATASFAFAVIGAETIGRLMDQLFVLHGEMRAKGQRLDEETRKEYFRLLNGIAATRQSLFVEALLKRAESDEPEQIRLMADLVFRHGGGKTNMLTLDDGLRESLATAIEKWIVFLLASTKANRHQMAVMTLAIGRIPDVRFVDGLCKMLKRDLSDWDYARESFKQLRPAGPVPLDVTTSNTLQYRRVFTIIGGSGVKDLMKQYLADVRFGFDAAMVLSGIWNRENEPMNEMRVRVWHDFSEVETKRLARHDQLNPPATSEFAEAIFNVVRQLGTVKTDLATQQHAIRLAAIGLRLPHGSKRSDFDALMALPLSFAAKQDLLTAAVEAGETIKADNLFAGLQELLEEAKNQPWRLDENRGELMGWIELFPFSDRPTAVIEGLGAVPAKNCQFRDLDRLLIALADGPPEAALQILKALVTRDVRIIENHLWMISVFKIGTEAAAFLILDLICNGSLPGRDGFPTRRMAELARKYPQIRAKLMQHYSTMPLGKAHQMMEMVLLEIADAEIILAFVHNYVRCERGFDGNLARAIHQTAVGKQPVIDLPSAYNEFSISLTTLRKELFSMVLANGSESSLAAACLNEIEELRDEHGRVNDEPRHPNIASGRAWPIEAESLCPSVAKY